MLGVVAILCITMKITMYLKMNVKSLLFAYYLREKVQCYGVKVTHCVKRLFNTVFHFFTIFEIENAWGRI